MKIKELKTKGKDELQKMLEDDREKLRQLRFDLSAGKVKNVREIRKIKKEVAQILTLLKTELPTEAKVEKRIKSSLTQK